MPGFELIDLRNERRLGKYNSEHAALQDLWFAIQQHGEQAVATIQLKYVDEHGHARTVAEGATLARRASLANQFRN